MESSPQPRRTVHHGEALAWLAAHPLPAGTSIVTSLPDLCEVALESYHRGVAALRAGASAEDLLDAAEVIHERGYTINDAYLHGFGVGLLPPSLNTRRTTKGRSVAPFVFEENMCVVLQPNVVTPDERSGLQLGNLFRITRDGAECLQRLPLQYFVAGS